MSTSSVTISGSSSCTRFRASYPLRAVPTTVNSPDASMICEVMRRMNALSSTTSTRGIAGGEPASALEDTRSLAQRTDLDASGQHIQKNAASVIAAGVLADNRDLRVAEHVTNCGDVAFADVDATGGNQIAEHARAADDLRGDTLGARAEPMHLGEQQRHGSG